MEDYVEVASGTTRVATGVITLNYDFQRSLAERNLTNIGQQQSNCENLLNNKETPLSLEAKEKICVQLDSLKECQQESLCNYNALKAKAPLRSSCVGVAASLCENGLRQWDGNHPFQSTADILTSPEFLYQCSQTASYTGNEAARNLFSKASTTSLAYRSLELKALTQTAWNQFCQLIFIQNPLPQGGNYNPIPAAYANNPVFTQYVCSITLDVIRYPVAIQNGQTTNYYEIRDLYAWVLVNGTDPLTRQPLALAAIQVDVNALQAIENEMRILGLPLQ